LGSSTYASAAANPGIAYVGFGKENAANATVQDFLLTEVPEPTNVLLLGCLLGLGMMRRKRK
jgi:hypothetical protein